MEKRFLFKSFSALALMFAISMVSAQETGEPPIFPKKPDVIPPSPTVSAFQTFTEIPVSHFTGQTQFSIPLAEVSSEIASFPITLSYKSSGLRLSEVSSVCGLGWDISTGGTISRVVNGLPDETPIEGIKAFLQSKNIPAEYATNNINDYLDLQNRVSSLSWGGFTGMDAWTRILKGSEGGLHTVDIEYDMFTYNFLNYSGSFILTYDDYGWFKVIPLEDNGLEFVYMGNAGFKVYDPQGREFIFGDVESAANAVETAVSVSISTSGTLGYDAVKNYTSSWHLSAVKKFGYTNQTITLAYEHIQEQGISFSYSYSFNYPTDDIYGHDGSISGTDTRITYTTSKLKTINWSDGSILFNYTYNDRKDLPTYSSSYKGARLNTISVKNSNGDEIKQISLQNEYKMATNTTGVNDASYVDNTYPYQKWWMFLTSVSIWGGDRTENPLTYKFDYFNADMPYQQSNAQDFWGYFNGVNNTLLIPNNTELAEYPVVNKADRSISSNIDIIKRGILTKVTYPTGGYTLFNYENNKYLNPENNQDEIVGGLRIASMEFRDAVNNSLKSKKTYTYTLENGKSSGVTPRGNLKRFHYESYGMKYELDPVYQKLYDFRFVKRAIFPQSPVLGYETVQGSSVGYTRVTVSDIDIVSSQPNGKDVFYYDGVYIDDFIESKYIQNGDFCGDPGLNYCFGYGDPYNFTSSFPNMSHSWETGRLLRKETYNGNGDILRKNEYITDNNTNSNHKYIPFFKGQVVKSVPSTMEVSPNAPNQIIVMAMNHIANSWSRVLFQFFQIKNLNRSITERVTDYVYRLDGVGNPICDAIVTENNSYYNDNLQPFLPSRVETVRTGDVAQETEFVYLPEFDEFQDPEGPQVIPSIVTKSVNKRAGKTISGYQIDDLNAQYNPTQISVLETENGTDLAFVPKRNITYNSTNFKVASISDEGQPEESYIYGYSSRLPVAKAVNATVGSWFHESFEDGGWNQSLQIDFAKTGKKATKACYADFSNNRAVNLIPGNKYRLSYWAKKGNLNTTTEYARAYIYGNNQLVANLTVYPNADGSWKYIEYVFTVPANNPGPYTLCVLSVGGSTPDQTRYHYVDDIRLAPAEAQVESYTWNPGVGVTSVTDPNGRTTYYLYDGMGRLVQVKDDEGNILEHHEYNYAQ